MLKMISIIPKTSNDSNQSIISNEQYNQQQLNIIIIDKDAVLCSNTDRQDHYSGDGAFRIDRQREAEDSGQGGRSSRPAAPHLRGQAA